MSDVEDSEPRWMGPYEMPMIEYAVYTAMIYAAKRAEKNSAPDSLTTSFPALDAWIGGLRPGKLYVIASAPDAGKTTFLLSMIGHLCLDAKVGGMLFSGDLTANQVCLRLIATHSRTVLSDDVQLSPLRKGDLLRIKETAKQMSNSGLGIDDARGLSVDELRAKVYQHKRSKKLAFIGIDHLHLLRASSARAGKLCKSERDEVIMKLKGLARELQVPVIVLAHVKARAEGRSQLRACDVKGSGMIAHEADVICFLKRHVGGALQEYQIEKDQEWTELQIVKTGDGRSGAIGLSYCEELEQLIPLLNAVEEQDDAWDQHFHTDHTDDDDPDAA